ncbi:hypothetical protein [Marinomonas sp. S3726]|uniref:hypothetical protein n=1 Tax=Marinomonas sp. S3726 TaxID=579484 RepID=UPI000698B370|nr:hypothetical protein [Marinomonas sp. S3726]
MRINTGSKSFWVVLALCLTLGASLATRLLSNGQANNQESSPNLVQKKPLKQTDLTSETTTGFITNELKSDKIADDLLAQEALSQIDPENIAVEEASLPRVLSSYTEAGARLDSFLEEHDIAYLDSSYYPFDAQTDEILRRYANSGKMLLFDNTQAKENLLEFNKTSGDLVSDYYGTGSESSMTIATSIKLANGGIEYMVLPVSTSDQESEEDLSEKVKLAIELFEKEQEKKQEANANS